MKKTIINRALIALVFAFTTISSHATGLGLGLDTWVGYGISADNANRFRCQGPINAGGSCSQGGLAFGGDLWLLELDQSLLLGLGAAYFSVLNGYTPAATSRGGAPTRRFLGSSVEQTMKTSYIPIVASFKYHMSALPIFVGGMLGYSIESSSMTQGSTVVDVQTNGGGAFTIGGFLAYQYKLTQLISIDAGAKVYLIFDIATIAQFIPFVGATFTL